VANEAKSDDLQMPPWPATVFSKIAAVHESGYSGMYVEALAARLKLAVQAMSHEHGGRNHEPECPECAALYHIGALPDDL